MSRHGAQPKLFDIGTELPNGFLYKPDFITEAEEDVLLAHIENLNLVHPLYKSQYEARRRIMGFGWGYDFESKRLIPGPPLPPFLRGVQKKIAKWLDIPARRVGHALVTEYEPNTAIGWHVDSEEFEHVVGLSLAGWCSMRLRPTPKGRRAQIEDGISMELERRSIYVIQGESRWYWQHSIQPTKTLRYSITFRTLPK